MVLVAAPGPSLAHLPPGRLDKVVATLGVSEEDITAAMRKEWGRMSSPRHLRWTSRSQVPPGARVLWGLWVITLGKDKEGDGPVKARWVWNGKLERDSSAPGGPVLTHATMAEDSTHLLQLEYSLAHALLIAVGDLTGAFNSSKRFEELAELNKQWAGREVYGIPPAIAGMPADAVCAILYPAYGLADGPAGLGASLHYTFTKELPYHATLLPSTYTLYDKASQPPHPTMGQSPDPQEVVSSYMDDLLLGMQDEGTLQQFKGDLGKAGWAFSKLDTLAEGATVDLCGALYTRTKDGIFRTCHVDGISGDISTPQEYATQLGKLSYWARKQCPMLMCRLAQYPRTDPSPQDLKNLARLTKWLQALPPQHPFQQPWRIPTLPSWKDVFLVGMSDVSLNCGAHRQRGGHLIFLVQAPQDVRQGLQLLPKGHTKASAHTVEWAQCPAVLLEASSAYLTRDCGNSSFKGEAVNAAASAARTAHLYEAASRAGLLPTSGFLQYTDHYGLYEHVTLGKPGADKSVAMDVHTLRGMGGLLQWYPGSRFPAHEMATPVHWSKSLLAEVMTSGELSLPIWSPANVSVKRSGPAAGHADPPA